MTLKSTINQRYAYRVAVERACTEYLTALGEVPSYEIPQIYRRLAEGKAVIQLELKHPDDIEAMAA